MTIESHLFGFSLVRLIGDDVFEDGSRCCVPVQLQGAVGNVSDPQLSSRGHGHYGGDRGTERWGLLNFIFYSFNHFSSVNLGVRSPGLLCRSKDLSSFTVHEAQIVKHEHECECRGILHCTYV